MSDFLKIPPPRVAAPVDQAQLLDKAVTLFALALVVTALYVGRAVFIPIAIAILLSFVLAPLVRLLRRWRVPRVPSVGLVVLLAVAVLGGLGAIIAQQLADFTTELPRYESTITRKIASIKELAAGGGSLERAAAALRNIGGQITEATPGAAPKPGDGGSGPQRAAPQNKEQPVPVEVRQPDPLSLDRLQSIASTVLEPLATAGIVLVFVIFILFQREDLRDRFIRLAGSGDLQRTTAAMNDAARRLSRYFLFQTLMNATFGTFIAIGLWLIGVPSPFLCGALAALMRFVPYVGAFIAAAVPILLAAAVAPGWAMMLEVAALFAITEPVVGQLIEPLVYGHQTGISPIAVIMSATFWTWLWGPIGLLLATPLTVCLVVLGRHVERLEFLDVLLGDAPALTPVESFYQRMLAADSSEVAEQAEQFIKERPLADYYDEIALEALLMAQVDVRRGALDEQRQARIRETIGELVEDLQTDEATGTHAEGEAAKAAEEQPAKTSIICIGGRTPLDEAAAALLAHLLQAEADIATRVEPASAMTPSGLVRLDAANADVICLSYLDGDVGPAQVRYGVRRLRRRFPRVKIVTCFWTADENPARMEQLCAAAKPDKCATRFHEALDAAREIVGSVSGAQAEPGARNVKEEATKEASAPTPLKGAA
ncbi:MAG TPA: AI-2E family transporter [Beijerinckiaceae bacterium]|jgi:predicted PurR-regulated permease PerM|nr:AI-2E family transporter [Beijerinckiaceae bacterium]